MGIWIYKIGLLFYHLILRVLSPFNDKARKFLSGRKGLIRSMKSQVPEGTYIWFHCASLGEFEQGRPVMEWLKKRYPEYSLVLTFFSPSGYEIRKGYEGADHIFYLPLDSANNARQFLDIIKPEIAVFVKYEFWHYYFKELKNRGIPLFVISSIFRRNQVFFRWYGGFYRKILDKCEMIFTQDQNSCDLLNSIGLDKVMKSGDTRFDRVSSIKNSNEEVPFIDSFKNGSPILIGGSIWPEDLETMAPLINNSPDNLKYILAPHEIEESMLDRIEKKINLPVARYSGQNPSEFENARVLIIDSIGWLSRIYKYADYAFIGGAYGDGLHNILEAAVFGTPLFFGDKNYLKFREARELIELGGAFAVKDSEEFKSHFLPLLDTGKKEDVTALVSEYVKENTGATEIITGYLDKYLK